MNGNYCNNAIGSKCSIGKPGASAYELAVECGYDGTLEEWLAEHASKEELEELSEKLDSIETKLNSIEEGAEANVVTSVADKTGDIELNKSDVGLANVDNTADADKPISTATQSALTALSESIGDISTLLTSINGE